MPVYNSEKYIVEAIESIIKQTYRNWELIVINDGSTDNSINLLSQFSDQRIRIIHQENQGVSKARNTGLKNISGSYFCFLDSDDILTNNSLTSRLEVFKEDDTIHFVDGVVEWFDKDKNQPFKFWTPQYKGSPTKLLIQASERCFFGPSWMIKVNPEITYAFNKNMTHVEDLQFYLSVSNSGNYSFTNQSILHYRRTDNGSAMNDFQKLQIGYIQYYRSAKELFPNNKEELKTLKLKIRRIMVLTFLKNRQPLEAIKSFFNLTFL